ncbi:MAG TPA: TonB-dependent receptor [Prolixibacteraceae bacterium]|nr:TonB-dependent receptor [Prolixibacteraceae bacterium]
MKTLFFLMILLAGSGALAQHSLRGTVMTSENEALPGASVVVEGTLRGTVTDENGRFFLENLGKGDYVIRVSFIGYFATKQSVHLAADRDLKIVLQKSNVLTEEVFVYSTRASAKTPIASTTVDSRQIESQNLGQDVAYLLQTTPSFVSSSDAGTGIGYTSFRIRGTDMNRINVTINGIPLNDPESHAVYWVNMPDFRSSLENIQVQRGVGTSTQGAGAFGATVNMQTRNVNTVPYAEYSGSAGSFRTLKNTFRVGTGLIQNRYSFEARLSKISSDGFIDRAFSDLKSFYLSGGYYTPNTLLKVNVFSGKEITYQAWNGVPSVRLKSDYEGMKRYEEHWLYSARETEEMIQSHPRTYNLYTYENETDNYQQDHYQLLFNHKFSGTLHLNAALHYTRGRAVTNSTRKTKILPITAPITR